MGLGPEGAAAAGPAGCRGSCCSAGAGPSAATTSCSREPSSCSSGWCGKARPGAAARRPGRSPVGGAVPAAGALRVPGTARGRCTVRCPRPGRCGSLAQLGVGAQVHGAVPALPLRPGPPSPAGLNPRVALGCFVMNAGTALCPRCFGIRGRQR